MNPQRYYGLDALRACMMLLGIVFHLALPYIGADSPGYFITGEKSLLLQLFLVTHYIRMPAFYLLSGFFSAMLFERRGWKEFLRLRWNRVGLVWIVGLALLYPLVGVVSVYNWYAKNSDHALKATVQAIASLQIHRSWLASPSIHLWFLEYLMLFCFVAAIAFTALNRFLPIVDRITAFVLHSRFRVFVLAAPTASVVITMPLAFVPYPDSLIPWLGVSLAYGWFFAVGWLIYRCRELLPSIERRAVLEKWTAPILCFLTLSLTQRRMRVPPFTAAPVLDFILAGTTALFMWSAVIALLVLFLRMRRIAWLSYLADASYWVYLAHFPLALLLPAVLRYWAVWPVVKVMVSAVSILAVLLWIYHLFIRYGAIGRALNGPREPLIYR